MQKSTANINVILLKNTDNYINGTRKKMATKTITIRERQLAFLEKEGDFAKHTEVKKDSE